MQDKKSTNNKVYTWKQIQQHNKFDDSWMVIEGVVYDVTNWAKTHPGGDIILLGGGTDATIMYHSYHPAGVKPELLKKYAIGTIKESEAIEEKSYYDDFNTDKFYNTLRERVCDYFKKKGITRRGEGIPTMYLKTAFIMINFFLGLYFMTVYGSYFAAFWMGMFAAEIGINVMHDGSHGAFSKVPFLNTLACWTMDLIGSSSYVWESQHVGGHHLWTNLEHDLQYNKESDPDVFSSYPFIRMHPSSERRWYHQYQHYYGPVLFMSFTMMKVLYNDYACFFKNKVLHISMNQRLSSKKNLIRITIWKILSALYMCIIPMIYNGALKGFLLFTVAHFTCGVILAFMFIVTHISEGCNFLEDGKQIKTIQMQEDALQQAKKRFNITRTTPASEKSWAALQCKTSVNWGLTSVFWTNFSGGLNHQIEHHLFPSICHMHYTGIQEIVERTCTEFEVPYIKYHTLQEAITGMVNLLRIMGNPPQEKKLK